MNSPPRVSADARAERFRSLYESTYADLLRFAQRRVHSSHAEDVVAEAFLAAWRRFDDAPEDARPWLFGVARNTMLNDRRGERRRTALSVRLADAEDLGVHPGHDDAEAVALRLDLTAAWRRLSDLHQETLALAVLDDLSAPEAAAVLGISPVAFRLRLTRARRALRTHLHHLPSAATMTSPAHPRTTT